MCSFFITADYVLKIKQKRLVFDLAVDCYINKDNKRKYTNVKLVINIEKKL